MAFTEFKTLTDVLVRYQITAREGSIIEPLSQPVSPALTDGMKFTWQSAKPRSEASRCERLIWPVLLEVYRGFQEEMTVLSHEYFGKTEPLTGYADYVIGKRSPLTSDIVEKPYVLVAEAKCDDFDDAGWAQCTAYMLAAQQINGEPAMPMWGLVTNGVGWQFGRLEGKLLTREVRLFSVGELDRLCGALRFVLERCREQILATEKSAA